MLVSKEVISNTFLRSYYLLSLLRNSPLCMDPKLHCCVQKRPTMIPNFGQKNQVDTFVSDFFNMNSNMSSLMISPLQFLTFLDFIIVIICIEE
jgi:hypothetical protein